MVGVEFVAGWLMPEIRKGITPEGLISFHMSFGIVILATMVLRFLWRLISPPPASEPTISHWQEFLSNATHSLLYVFVIALPISGWWIASTHGWVVSVFGTITLPALAVVNVSMGRTAITVHVLLATTVALLIGIHVLGALYHYFIEKDKVLQRMIPGV